METEIELVGGNALTHIIQAETDIQIATAKRYPRSLTDFQRNALSMATIDEETAASCFYVLPRDGKTIEGPSVRLAEICASAWGNLRFGARIIGDDGKMVTAQGFAWDIERNNAASIESRRRVTKKDGKRYSDDMVITTCNAAASIALRNAIFKVIPMAYVKQIWREARMVAVGDAKTLVVKRSNMIAYYAKMGVDEKKILGLLEKKSAMDIGIDELVILRGLATALKDGDTTIEEAFAGKSQSSLQAIVAQAVAEPAKANGSHQHAQEELQNFPPDEEEPVKDETPPPPSKDEIFDDIRVMLREYLGDDPKAITTAVQHAFSEFKVKGIEQIKRLDAELMAAGAKKLLDYLNSLPNAD